jgi:hypothetical protein
VEVQNRDSLFTLETSTKYTAASRLLLARSMQTNPHDLVGIVKSDNSKGSAFFQRRTLSTRTAARDLSHHSVGQREVQ